MTRAGAFAASSEAQAAAPLGRRDDAPHFEPLELLERLAVLRRGHGST